MSKKYLTTVMISKFFLQNAPAFPCSLETNCESPTMMIFTCRYLTKAVEGTMTERDVGLRSAEAGKTLMKAKVEEADAGILFRGEL